MKTLFRLSLGACLLGALIAGGSYACPRITARLGLNLTEWLEAQQRLAAEQQRRESLDRQGEIVWNNLETKFQVVEELRAGHLGLHEAAVRFRDLRNPEGDSRHQLLRLFYPGRSDDERWCRQVIAFVRGGASYEPDLRAVADRLEAELNQDLASGVLRLPE